MDPLTLGQVEELNLGLCDTTYRAGVIHDGHCFFYAFLIAMDPSTFLHMPKAEFTRKVITFRKNLRVMVEKEIHNATSVGKGKKHPFYRDLSNFLEDMDLKTFLDHVEGKQQNSDVNIWAGEEIWEILQDLFKCKIFVFLNVDNTNVLYRRTYTNEFFAKTDKIFTFLNLSETYYEPILFKTKKGELRGEVTRRSCLYDDIQNMARLPPTPSKKITHTPSPSPSSSPSSFSSPSPSSSSYRSPSSLKEKKRSSAKASKNVGLTGAENDLDTMVRKMNLRNGRAVIVPNEGWEPNTSDRFPEWYNQTFYRMTEIDPRTVEVDNRNFHPQIYQLIVRDYLQFSSPYRGLLIYHGLGTGKTCTSIGVAELLSQQRNVTIMMEARLRGNYLTELKERCGHGSYVSNQHWKFVNVRSNDKLVKIFPNLDSKIVNKHKGIWIAGESTTSKSYTSLSYGEQEQINTQIKSMLENRYRFINYNGITNTHLNTLSKNNKVNPFDNQVVIIDEVHNFISRVINKVGSKDVSVSGRLYDFLLTAKNVRIVMLSGTPILNHPFELAYMINLLRGWQIRYMIRFKTTDIPSKYTKVLQRHPRVMDLKLNADTISFEVTPVGFIMNALGRLESVSVQDDDDAENEIISLDPQEVFEQIVSAIQQDDGKLPKGQQKYGSHSLMKAHMLPITRDDFSNTFFKQSNDDKIVVQEDRFMRAAMGCVSYFEKLDKSLFPEIKEIRYIDVAMSVNQFNLYSLKRKEEVDLETRSKMITGARDQNGDEPGQVYKAFTRALCNFAFPDEIKRPYMKNMRVAKGELEMDINDDGMGGIDEKPKVKGKENDLERRYMAELQDAMRALQDNSEVYLKRDLHLYSPKMATIIQKVSEQMGKALVYSQFRTVEGIGIFQRVLVAHGWQPVRLVKLNNDWRLADMVDRKPGFIVFGEDAEANEILLNIYNSDFDNLPKTVLEDLQGLPMYNPTTHNMRGEIAKLMMISRAGAEGINTKGCRSVHIMEPYWNSIRIDQVIGRAVRMKSHISLPPDERNVEIFIYRAIFTKEQINSNFTIRTKDGGKSTDQMIYDLAKKKQDINNKFLTMLKRAAIDCAIHQHENIVCYNPNSTSSQNKTKKRNSQSGVDSLGSDEDILAPKIRIDDLDPDLEVQRIRIRGTPYLLIGKQNQRRLFDYMGYVKGGVLILRGWLRQIGDKIYLIKKNE